MYKALLCAVGPLTPGSRMMPTSPQDPATQLNTFKTYVTLIADSTPGSKLQRPTSESVVELFFPFSLNISSNFPVSLLLQCDY